jgi:hypothetical protein
LLFECYLVGSLIEFNHESRSVSIDPFVDMLCSAKKAEHAKNGAGGRWMND